MTNYRQQRLAGLLLEELRIIIGNELDDPKLTLVEVTDVVVSKDLRHVKVFVNHQEDEVQRQAVLRRLQHATPYLRSQIAERLTLRAVPELLFYYDETPEKAARLDSIFKQIAGDRQVSPSNDNSSNIAPPPASSEENDR